MVFFYVILQLKRLMCFLVMLAGRGNKNAGSLLGIIISGCIVLRKM